MLIPRRTLLFATAAFLSKSASAGWFPLGRESVPGGGTIDLTLLPALAAQTPDNTAYNALSVASQSAGFAYDDPVTGVRVFKITDASTPVSGANNALAVPDYFESGPRVSHPWSGNYTILVMVQTSGGNNSHWLVDFDYDAETFGNWRAGPAGSMEVGAGFSLKAETPQVLFKIQSGVLRKWDTSTAPATEISAGGFPKDLSAHLDGAARFEWLGFGIDERFFAMMNQTKTQIVVWDSQEDAALLKDATDTGWTIDEPKMERNGRYVWIRRSGVGSSVWWDLNTDTLGTASLDSSNNYKGHAGLPRGYAAGCQSDSETAQWYATPPSAVPTVVNATESMVLELNCAGQWVTQSPADETQYVVITGNGVGNYGPDPVLVQKAIAFCRMDGSDRRLLCHHYGAGVNHTTDTYYKGYAWGQPSPDGKLIMFKSSMNSNTGRADCFLVKTPLAA